MSTEGAPRIETSVKDGIARLTLENPKRKNALTLDMANDVIAFCRRVHDDAGIGAVVVAGSGGYFCSGADTRDLATASSDPASSEAITTTSNIYGTFLEIAELPVPSISVVEGGCVGAGLNLALATDLMLVTPDAIIDSGFLARGIHPGGGHFALLSKVLSYPQIIRFAVLGQALSGAEAVGVGLAHQVVDAADLVVTAESLLAPAGADPALVRRAKKSARTQAGISAGRLEAAVEIERGVQMWSMGRKGREGWSRAPAGPDPSSRS